MHEGEVAVQDEDVVVVDLDALQGRGSVVHDVDRHGLPAQSGGHRIGEQLLVLDDEYAHVAGPFRGRPRQGDAARGPARSGAGGGARTTTDGGASILPLSAINRR
ncbi:putative two-component regulator CutR [Streptomyces sp. Tu6071]|nr:putative two-component regulator CutR [Streptomyces sp. Tu6071]